MDQFKITRDMYIPEGGVKVEREGITGELYKYERDGSPCMVMFIGKTAAPVRYFRYATVEKRDAAIERFFDTRAIIAKCKAEQDAAEKALEQEAV